VWLIRFGKIQQKKIKEELKAKFRNSKAESQFGSAFSFEDSCYLSAFVMA
jgi:hypothetical protein